MTQAACREGGDARTRIQPVGGVGGKSRATGKSVPTWTGIAAALAIVVAGFVGFTNRKSAPSPAPVATSASEPKAGAPAPIAPAEPRRGPKSIVVRPFENLSADQEANAVFVDGMHVDVISNLLRIRELRGVPRDPAMTYRGAKKTPKAIAEELGWRLC